MFVYMEGRGGMGKLECAYKFLKLNGKNYRKMLFNINV